MNHLERDQLKSEIATLHLLLGVNEAAALDQAGRADRAIEEVRREAAGRLAQTELIHGIIDASSDAIMVLGEEGEFLYVNDKAAREIFQGKDVVGKSLLVDFPQVMPAAFLERYQAARVSRQPISFEDYYAPGERWVAVTVSPIGDGIAVFFRDVTDRRQREAALHKTEKLAAVGRLASSISHEINNPLESVVNLLYLIEQPATPLAEVRTYAALAAAELARVSHIVTQTLKFHRQSTAAVETRMSEVLDSVVSLFQGRVATRQIEIHRRYSPADKVVCFAGDMRQVFANLIANALDAIPDHGTVCLRTNPSRDWKTGRLGVRVLVSDNGSGMSETTQKSLFEPFFTTKPATGTGLGLWVSEEIIRNHQGSIRARSSQRPGRSGTTFSLFFPVAD